MDDAGDVGELLAWTTCQRLLGSLGRRLTEELERLCYEKVERVSARRRGVPVRAPRLGAHPPGKVLRLVRPSGQERPWPR